MKKMKRLVRRLMQPWLRLESSVPGIDLARWMEAARSARPPAIALTNPHWKGVTSATRNLFPMSLPVNDDLVPRTAQQLADRLAETGVRRIVISGLPWTYLHLIDALRRRHPQIECRIFWLGSLMQSGEQTNWKAFCQVNRLAREGAICKVGFAKSGMAELMQGLGIRSSFVLSAIDRMPVAASEPDAGGPHLGVWAVNMKVWRKTPFAMLAAAREIPGAKLHLSGGNKRVAEYVRELGLVAEMREKAIPAADMPAHLMRMHLNLYVTLSECCPMLPLESLAEGVPCLLGPSSHLFEDDPYLFSRLVVPFPDRHEVIARYLRQALEERDEIVAAYRRYLPGYLERTDESLAEFLDLPWGTRLRRVEPTMPADVRMDSPHVGGKPAVAQGAATNSYQSSV